jgi:hypothetical protein
MRFGFLILFTSSIALAAPTPTKVKIHFLEALAPKDTTSSERFQKEYESAISTGKTLVAKKLSACGYQIEDSTVFYNASDSIEALEKAKVAEKNATWLIVGPRRSNHYLLLVKGAPDTASISNMASSEEVMKLGKRHLTVAPSNQQMAAAAIETLKKRFASKKPITYVSVLSEDCVTCVDFAAQFNEHAKRNGLKLLREIKIAGDEPDLVPATAAVSELKPTVVLLPNYSRVTALAIAAIHKVYPSAFYVGGDGWGDANFGFVQNGNDLDKSLGLTVRGFPPTDEALKHFPLGKELLAESNSTLPRPGSGSALAILKIIEGTADLLCKYKPKDEKQFRSVFEKYGKPVFKSPWGVSVYDMKGGNIAFTNMTKVR